VTRQPLFITGPLLDVLLELAADAAPKPANVQLVQSAAGDLDPADGAGGDQVPLGDLEPATPVFSDFYFPDVGRALDFVFGVDLGTPAGTTQGRFLSHPDGDPALTVRDDLHAAVLVATPPWRPENVLAYARDGTEQELRVVAAASPERDFED
jgi:hypothetical protein